MKTLAVSDDRDAWLSQFQSRLTGTPIETNAGDQAAYGAALEKIVEKITVEAERTVRALARLERHEDTVTTTVAVPGMDAGIGSQARIAMNALKARIARWLQGRVRNLAEDMIAKTDRTSAANVGQSLKELSGGLSIPTKSLSPALKEAMKASVAENVSLITHMTDAHLAKIEGAVLRSIVSGNGLQDLVPEIRQIGGASKTRALRIALDQTRKANAAMSRERLRSAGVRKFKWVHGAGSKSPRRYHLDKWPLGLNGGIFSMDDPPVIDNVTMERGFPGQAINCKCRMVPVIEFDDDTGEAAP